MSSPALDRERILQALALAETSFGLTEPNPRVGCVIGAEDGRVYGTGATQQAGGPHAEVVALRSARANGHDLRGATAWVTLEPCAHHGRTPPCCDALVEAGLARVVIAVGDPFPGVAGAGIARLRAAGIRVDMADGDLALAARDINIGFFSRIERGRPWVRLKVAASVDGRTALPNGTSQWITGPESRADGHAWRHRASAVMTGIGTVLADDPRLDVRLVPANGQPLRVVVDSRLRTPPTARLLEPPGRVLVITAQEVPARRQMLEQRGAEVVQVEAQEGRVCLAAALRMLASRGVNELHVEAGSVLNAELLESRLADELLLYMAPTLIGEGRGIATLPTLEHLQQAVTLRFLDVQRIGSDLRLRATIPLE